MTAYYPRSWWGQDNDGFAPLMSNQEEMADDAPLGTIQLRPSNRHCAASAVLKHHRLDLEGTSLSILGGLLIKFQYFNREKHPAHGNSWRMWLPPFMLFFCAIAIGVIQGLISRQYEQLEDGVWSWFVLILFNSSLFFVDWEACHRKSKVYQSALRRFHEGVHELLHELNCLLQPHGFFLEAKEPDLKTGCVEVHVRRALKTQGSLPPVSDSFLQRAKPLTELNDFMVMYSVLAMGIPIDEWTLGALMMRYRCIQKELRKDGKLAFWTNFLFIVTLVLAMAVDVALYSYFFMDNYPFMVFVIWYVPFIPLLLLLSVVLTRLAERFDGPSKHQRYSEATSIVSPLAVQRHGVKLVYKVVEGNYGTTKGIVQFAPVESDTEGLALQHFQAAVIV